MANLSNGQPGCSKNSIMAITFGIVGKVLGVTRGWLGVRRGVRRYRE
jgi:hypothetical protein